MLSVHTVDVEFLLCPSGMYAMLVHKYYSTNMYVHYVCVLF